MSVMPDGTVLRGRWVGVRLRCVISTASANGSSAHHFTTKGDDMPQKRINTPEQAREALHRRREKQKGYQKTYRERLKALAAQADTCQKPEGE
jgi:hypothetical protein